jgi:DHA3 family tetracycline resistance protein-like MFS transporter
LKRLPAATVYYASELWISLAFSTAFTVSAVYFVQDVGMNPLELVLVGTVMELTVFAFEVPTGVVADTYSRRLSILIGWVVFGVGLVVAGAVASFWVVLLGWAIWGLGWTFQSGALQAWITDEVGVEEVGRVFARGEQFSNVGALVGIGVSVAAALQSPRLAVVLGGALTMAFGVAAAFVMPETRFSRKAREERDTPLGELRATARNGVRYTRAQPLILLLMAITFFAGASTESFDRLREAHLLENVGLPDLWGLDAVAWFGVLGAGSLLLGIGVQQVIIRRFERVGSRDLARLLAGLTVVQAVAVLAFALSGEILLAAAAFWVYYQTRNAAGPLYTTWLNQNIGDSSVRATVISISNQSDAIGQVAGGPALGAIGTVWGLRAALAAGASLLLPTLALYGRAIRHEGREPELADLPAPETP